MTRSTTTRATDLYTPTPEEKAYTSWHWGGGLLAAVNELERQRRFPRLSYEARASFVRQYLEVAWKDHQQATC